MRLQVFVRLTEHGDDDQPAPFFMDTNTASWKRLKHLFSEFYGDGFVRDVEVWYWDEEDMVIVSSQEELDEACRLAEEGGRSFLQFYVQRVVKGTTGSNNQQPAADSTRGAAAVDHVREEQFQERKGTGVEHPECSMWENSQPSELPKAEKPRSIFDNTPKQPNNLADAMDSGTEEGLDLLEKAQGKNVSPSAGEAASSSLVDAHARLLDFMQRLKVSKESRSEAGAMQRSEGGAHRQSKEAEVYATLRKMTDYYDEGRTQEQSDEDESADRGHFMLPGALSGANVIAIEMPEMEHQGTESAEPAEIAETGEVTTKSSRDAETGFWMQPQLEAEVKHDSRDNVEYQAHQTFQEDAIQRYFSEAELRRKVSTMVEKQQASSDRLQQKKHERKASRTDSAHKKKKHRGGESVSEESVSDFVMKGKSSTSKTSKIPLDVVSEEASSSTRPSPHKKHEVKPSKSEAEGKKKKDSTELLTKDTFVRYMMKLEVQMKKDIAKTVARKTVRGVLKNLPKLGEGSETPTSTPVIPSQQTGYVHEGIICDCCDREIVGTRYICGNCPNYDLCEECESIQPSFHDCTHVFIKLRRPCVKAGTRHGMRVPLLKRVIYESRDEERKEDLERIQVIQECAEGQESQAERHVSRSSNNEDEEEGGLSEPPSQDEQEEEYQTLENSERMYDVNVSEVADIEAETNMSRSQLMENAEPLYRTIPIVTENVESVPDPELISFYDQPTAFNPTELLRHIIAVRPIPEMFTIYGHPGVYIFEKRTSEGRAPYESEVQYFFKTRESADDYADCQPTIFHATELMVHVISQKLFPPAFVVKGIPDLYLPNQSAAPEASKVTFPDWWTQQTTEHMSEAAADEEDDDQGPEEDLYPEEDHLYPEEDLYPECVEDGFVVCSPTQGCSEEQVTGERSTSPASSIEVVEPITSSQETMTVEDETGVRVHQSTQCQRDDASSLGSLTDESSSDEDFVVIVPDCFDTSKPLDPVSLQRLLNKGNALKNKLDKDRKLGPVEKGLRELSLMPVFGRFHHVTFTPEFGRRRLEKEKVEKSCTSCMASGEEIVHVLPQTEGEETSSTPCNQLGILDQNPDDHLHLAEEEPDSSKEMLDAVSYFRSLGRPERKVEGKRTAVTEEEQEEDGCAQQDLPWVTEASSNQLEACAAVDHIPKPSQEVEASQSQSHSFRSSTQDPKDPDVSNIHQTDLKCPQEFEEEGAVADPDSLDPEQQLNDIVTNTFKKASSGLQQLYKTGKDIFKTLQRGDSYEPEESTYVFKPADYKLPESTWRPSNKEFVMPKSNFKLVEKEFHMPKTTYSGPQTQAPSAGVYSGEFSGPLQRIREMGYFNNERTLALLRKYEGDVEKVVNELIEETDSDWADRRHGNGT